MEQTGESHAHPHPDEPQIEMGTIPAGPFLMGSPTSDHLREDVEPAQFELTIAYDYAIGITPITVGQFRAFIDAGGYRQRAHWTQVGWSLSSTRTAPDHWENTLWAGDDQLPVVGVSWYEASAFAAWLAAVTGRDYRLPSEAEWEKAARGGLHDNPHPARRWPWGDESPGSELLNFASNVAHTTAVGHYRSGASAYNVLDLAGNVWEWCRSRWTLPYVSPEDANLEGDVLRVVRGGSWFNTAAQARCSSRLALIPNLRGDHDVGFRVVEIRSACGE